MFSIEERAALRTALVAEAQRDPQVTAAALVGSAAAGREDRWSDVDLALRLAPGADQGAVSDSWSGAMYERYGAVHHLDVRASGALYRVFLLASSLQVDVSFWPDGEFRATGPAFQLLFGEAGEPSAPRGPDPGHLAGMGWLYGLHARSAIARGRYWQALMMLDGVRDRILELACVRLGLNPHDGRGADGLPAEYLRDLMTTRARDVGEGELRRSLEASISVLLAEIGRHDSALAARLDGPVSLVARLDA